MSLLRHCVLGLLLLAGCGCTPTFDWRDARPADGLEALFPCKPDRHARPVVISGLSLTMTLSSCSAGDHTFAVSQIEAADAAQVAPLLQALRSALVANVSADASAPSASQTSADVPGATSNPLAGRLVVSGRRGDGSALQAQGEFFCKGLRIYQATVVGHRLDPSAMDVFFSSLKLPN